MNNTELQITRNISRPSRDAASYRVTYAQISESDCHELRQIGDVWNNILHLRGVYATLAEAEAAATRYITGED